MHLVKNDPVAPPASSASSMIAKLVASSVSSPKFMVQAPGG
jgi:hypothetical protein